MIPGVTVCLEIFSPFPGESDVISHVERFSSNETKIAPNCVRIAAGSSDECSCTIGRLQVEWSATSVCLQNRPLSTSPWNLRGTSHRARIRATRWLDQSDSFVRRGRACATAHDDSHRWESLSDLILRSGLLAASRSLILRSALLRASRRMDASPYVA